MPDTSDNSKHEPQQGGNTSDKAPPGGGSSENDQSSHKDNVPVDMKQGGEPTVFGEQGEDGEREINTSQ
ncbi:hypothetical protein CEP52_014758 [Fusarium oligoseptatum]|uniref:Uncharacterized protein n=1 Tax=Fusarium oligoseptatum TaxID=2604345 RepID=A0A428SJD4_9HYPO|nr:hypothetical protein CEP52_014758 [Fusarium oligoseptatum]